MESNVISNLKTVRLFDKQAFWHLAILVLIGAAIGVYLIATTVIISKDGVFYIQRTQRFAHDPVEVVKQHPPGLPIMIYVAHKAASVFFDGDSVYTWIYSAQAATVMCRLLAIAGLYLLGKLLVGGRDSFWAMVVLLILPYPAHMSTEVLREWPHLVFLAWGYFVLVYAVKRGSWQLFGVAGMLAGLGYIVRPEALQIFIFGIALLILRFWRPAAGFSRKKSVLAVVGMTAGLMVVVLPYANIRGRFVPDRLKSMMTHKNINFEHSDYETSGAEIVKDQRFCKAGFDGGKLFDGIGKLFERISQNLMYFFVLPVAIGLYLRFKKGGGADGIERVIVLGAVILYFAMMVSLYLMSDYMSRRHCLPMVVFTIFYIPLGVRGIAEWICEKAKKNTAEDIVRARYILFAIGLGLCLPKLFTIRDEKAGYLEAANWLRANTAEDAVLVTEYSRIPFYAQRRKVWPGNNRNEKYEYYGVDIVEAESGGKTEVEKASFWVDQDRKKKKVVIRSLSE